MVHCVILFGALKFLSMYQPTSVPYLSGNQSTVLKLGSSNFVQRYFYTGMDIGYRGKSRFGDGGGG